MYFEKSEKSHEAMLEMLAHFIFQLFAHQAGKEKINQRDFLAFYQILTKKWQLENP